MCLGPGTLVTLTVASVSYNGGVGGAAHKKWPTYSNFLSDMYLHFEFSFFLFCRILTGFLTFFGLHDPIYFNLPNFQGSRDATAF